MDLSPDSSPSPDSSTTSLQSTEGQSSLYNLSAMKMMRMTDSNYKDFYILYSLITKAQMCPNEKWHFPAAREQFWPDAFPGTIGESYRWQWEAKPGFLGWNSITQHLNHWATAAAKLIINSNNDKMSRLQTALKELRNYKTDSRTLSFSCHTFRHIHVH